MAEKGMVGNDIVLWVATGTDPGPPEVPIYEQVAQQTDYVQESTRDEIDVSHKGNDHMVVMPGRETGSITLTLRVLRPNTADTTHVALRDAYRDRTPVFVQEVSTFPGAAGDGSEDQVLEGEGQITTFTKNAPDNDGASWDVTISLSGPMEEPAE